MEQSRGIQHIIKSFSFKTQISAQIHEISSQNTKSGSQIIKYLNMNQFLLLTL